MAINPNSAFVRVVFDLETPLAIAFNGVVAASGKSKKRYLADLIAADVAAKTKGGKKR